VDPVPDTLLLRKSGSARNWIWICRQELLPLDHRGGHFFSNYLHEIKNSRYFVQLPCVWVYCLQERCLYTIPRFEYICTAYYPRKMLRGWCPENIQLPLQTFQVRIIIIIIIIIYLFTAIGFAPGGSSPTLVQTKTIKQHYTLVQHNTIKRKHTIIHTQNNKIRTQYNKIQWDI
jgi:hypothetical protein